MLLNKAINYYSPTLFGSLGITDVALYTGIYGLVKGKPRSLDDVTMASNANDAHPSRGLRHLLRSPH